MWQRAAGTHLRGFGCMLNAFYFLLYDAGIRHRPRTHGARGRVWVQPWEWDVATDGQRERQDAVGTRPAVTHMFISLSEHEARVTGECVGW